LHQERLRAGQLANNLEGIAALVASTISYLVTTLVTVFVVVIAIFPLLDSTELPPFLQRLAQGVTVLLGILGGVFGFAAVPWGRKLRNRIKSKILQRIAGTETFATQVRGSSDVGGPDPEKQTSTSSNLPLHSNDR
jgi:hypothetical protein